MNLIKKTWEEIKADPKTVREFGFILSGFFLCAPIAVALIKTFFGRQPFHYWWGWLFFSAAALGINLFLASWMALIYRAAMFIAHGISWVMMRVILGILFYLVISPLSIAMRLLGKDLLDEKIDKSAATYWRKRSSQFNRGQYEKLF